LLLVGAGHAHLEVIRRFHEERLEGVDLTVVTQDPWHYYSGMIPAFLNGSYERADVGFDVETLIAKLGARFVLGRALRIDLENRAVEYSVESGEKDTLPYDLVSFNLGSGLLGTDTPGVREHAELIKPLSRVVELRRRLTELAGRNGDGGLPTVVGGGSAGVELACSLAAHRPAGVRPRARILEASERILAGYTDRFRERAARVLESQGIEVRTGARVVEVGDREVTLEGGESLPAEPTVWLTGASAPPLFRDSALETDDRGFMLVNDSLQYLGDQRVYGVGDCVTLARYPETPKAGVYSVRMGPVLWGSLTAALEGGEPPSYAPQNSFLSLLNTADGRALMRYKGWISHSRYAWWLKDWIDRDFMAKYKKLY
jgi:NADH dehydrogenase FAD-containing subunit